MKLCQIHYSGSITRLSKRYITLVQATSGISSQAEVCLRDLRGMIGWGDSGRQQSDSAHPIVNLLWKRKIYVC